MRELIFQEGEASPLDIDSGVPGEGCFSVDGDMMIAFWAGALRSAVDSQGLIDRWL